MPEKVSVPTWPQGSPLPLVGNDSARFVVAAQAILIEDLGCKIAFGSRHRVRSARLTGVQRGAESVHR
jgi:hypothetical protein